jgi:hypothetical protein
MSWPAPLRSIVMAREADAVWTKGLEILGYPPTWATTGKELDQVRQAFKEK